MSDCALFHKMKKKKGDGGFSQIFGSFVCGSRVRCGCFLLPLHLFFQTFVMHKIKKRQNKIKKIKKVFKFQSNCQEVLWSQNILNMCHVAIYKDNIVMSLHAFKFLFFFKLNKLAHSN